MAEHIEAANGRESGCTGVGACPHQASPPKALATARVIQRVRPERLDRVNSAVILLMADRVEGDFDHPHGLVATSDCVGLAPSWPLSAPSVTIRMRSCPFGASYRDRIGECRHQTDIRPGRDLLWSFVAIVEHPACRSATLGNRYCLSWKPIQGSDVLLIMQDTGICSRIRSQFQYLLGLEITPASGARL